MEEDSYFPDFSDMYNESFEFWDFMGQKSDGSTPEERRLQKGTSSNAFWDFLSSEHSPAHSCHFSDFFSSSDKREEEKPHTRCSNIRETCHDVQVQKSSASDEFWDFLNSSAEKDNNCAAASFPCSSNSEKQIGCDSPLAEATPSEDGLLPRISSVFSVKSSNSSSFETPENISQTRSIVRHTETTDGAVLYNNPMKGTNHSKVEYSTVIKTLKLENPSTTNSYQIKEGLVPCLPSASVNEHSEKRVYSVICDPQSLELKAENISRTENIPVKNTNAVNETAFPVMMQNVCLNNAGTKPLYVLLPSSEILQKSNCSQYFIIVNNAAPPTLNHGALYKNGAPKHPVQSVASSDPSSANAGIGVTESDLRLAGFRNNHVLLNTRKVESEPSENKCLLPLCTAPLDEEIIQTVSTRMKSAQNSCAETVNNKQMGRMARPIKSISLGRCKNAFQQINTPIRMDAFETSAESTLWKPRSDVNLFLPFAQNPISNKDQITAGNPGGQTNASCPMTRIHGLYTLPSLQLPPIPPPHAATKVLILQDARQNLLPRAPHPRNKRVSPKMKKCRRKTVKELLQEHPFRHASKGAEMPNALDTTSTRAEASSHPTPEGSTHCVSKQGSLRPRHYDMSELQIGYLKVQEDVDACGSFRSKFKVLFMKGQFLYDFPLCRCNQPGVQGEWGDEMARIAVPFRTITSISLNDRMIHLKVDSTPLLSLGNALSRFTENSSCWGHFLQTSFTHKVVLRKRQASKLKSILCQFDERFITLMNKISHENQLNSSPVSFKKRFSKNRKLPVRRLPETNDKSLLLNQMCCCRTNCRSIRCSCVKAAKSCNSAGATCQCTNCNNPLNVLETVGLDIRFSLNDSCLFQNIYQIPDLSNYLLREVRLECCNCLARILDCIPGTILCPNVNCNSSLEYSWCQKMVSYPERNPRNHCTFCGQCCFSNGRHCHVCKKCYAVTATSNKCPTCPPENLTQFGPPKSLNTFCYNQNTCRSSSRPQIIVLDSSTYRNKSMFPEEENNSSRQNDSYLSEASSILHCQRQNQCPHRSTETKRVDQEEGHQFKIDYKLKTINKMNYI